MNFLEEYILNNATVVDSSILKVDSFINHQINPNLIMKIGQEFKNLFSSYKITKVLTVEASGIAIGLATAYALGVDLVFAKKKKPSTMGDSYSAKVFSFTKSMEYDITVSKEFIKEDDFVLIVDDFLAMGNAVLGLNQIVKEAGASLVGVGIVIEKGFQAGRKRIEEEGIEVKSIVEIESLDEGVVSFKKK